MSSIISSPIFSGLEGQDVAAEWGNISGTLANQTDLQSSLNTKSERFPIIISANANATIGRSHHVTGAFTVVLPDGSNVGELIRMTKDIGVLVTVDGNIETSSGTTLTIDYDVNEEIVFRWNGTHWEI